MLLELWWNSFFVLLKVGWPGLSVMLSVGCYALTIQLGKVACSFQEAQSGRLGSSVPVRFITALSDELRPC